jgi:hypothetical protein
MEVDRSKSSPLFGLSDFMKYQQHVITKETLLLEGVSEEIKFILRMTTLISVDDKELYTDWKSA